MPIGDHTQGFLRRSKLIPQVLDLGPKKSKLRFLLADRLRVYLVVCIEAFKSPT